MNIFILFGITFTCSFLQNVVSNAHHLPYEAFINFGDSISDTGNAQKFLQAMPNNPQGSTYFKHPAGRFSDGRLIIDFIAEAYGLPFLPAYWNTHKDKDISKGVNFAYGGATILDVEYYVQNGLARPDTNSSLSIQLGWFKNLKSFLCKSKKDLDQKQSMIDCKRYFKKTLFQIGEIGLNDIFKHIVSHKTVPEIREIVPIMVEGITNTSIVLLEEGVVELAVTGNLPLGCNAGFLGFIKNTTNEDYDEFGCLIAYNALSEYFNEQLTKSIETLRKKYPQANIIYFDYYNNAKRLYETPQQYGFDKDDISMACWSEIGSPNEKLCSDPSKRMSWDGVHYTEAAYKLIAKGLIEGPFSNPSLKSPPFKIA